MKQNTNKIVNLLFEIIIHFKNKAVIPTVIEIENENENIKFIFNTNSILFIVNNIDICVLFPNLGINHNSKIFRNATVNFNIDIDSIIFKLTSKKEYLILIDL